MSMTLKVAVPMCGRCRTRLMLFNELALVFSDDDNQRMSRELLNRVCSYILY